MRNGAHILNSEDIQENKPTAIRHAAKVRISRRPIHENGVKGERLQDGEDIQEYQPHLHRNAYALRSLPVACS